MPIDWTPVHARARAGDWDGLHALMSQGCRPLDWATGPALDNLRDRLREALREALDQASGADDVLALFVELDPGTGQTGVYLCEAYLPEEDWPGDFTRSVDGPTVPSGDLAYPEIYAAGGAVFQALGQALGDVAPVGLPVGFGLHDDEILYAPLPPGAMTPEQVPRLKVPAPVEGIYRLDPLGFGSFDTTRYGVIEAAPDTSTETLLSFDGWKMPWRNRTADSDRITWQLVGPAQDVQRTTKMRWLISERLVSALRDQLAPDEELETYAVTVTVDEQGETAPCTYFAGFPTKRVRSVDLPPEHRVKVARKRAMPAFRASDLAGRRVFAEDTRHFTPPYIAIVTADVLAALRTADCLDAVKATPLIVLDEADMPPSMEG